MNGYIYALECPTDNKIKYVGQTRRKLNNRLNQHIRRVKNKGGYLTKKEAWIKKLINEGVEKQIKVICLEECPIELLNDREIYWIFKLGEEFDLTNLTNGGTGFIPFENKKHKSLSEESRNKISLANSGEKNGMFGKHPKRTEEQKEKARINMINSDKFQKSRKSKEYREKISDIFSVPLCLLNENLDWIMDFKNTKECAEHFDYTRGNIKNAVRHLRKIGKGKKDKYWVVRKEKLEESIISIKEKRTL